MLEHLGHQEHAELLQQAARNTLLEGQTTPDLGGSLDTQGVRDALLVQVDALTAD